ncbi:MAG: Coenzyme F420 hydrogenase/dehydrogenase, beta subunit C-terminal domain [Syntrophales bacterium]
MRLNERDSNRADTGIGQGGQKKLEESIIRTGLCTGCGACVNLCPYQASYRDRTVTLHPCDLERGRCYACCPRTPVDREDLRRKLHAGTDWTPEVGAVEGFFITRATDEGIRQQAQHGGTVTALIALALREGLIDAAVIAAEGEGLLPQAITVSDPEAAGKTGKSRFVVSPTVAEFNRAVRSDYRRIGVVATPCQALALAKMRTQPVTAPASGIEKLQLVVGLFCGWALSWRDLVALVKEKTDLARVTGMDIPPSRYHTLEVSTEDGTIRVSLDEVNPCVRESCRSCDDMTAEYSDISVGSARLPEGWETARGWNQVIVRTKRGGEILDLARRRGVLEFRDVPAGNWEKLKAASLNKKRAAANAPAVRAGSTDTIGQVG